MLYGRYFHNLDAKGRIFVPAKLRDKLGEDFMAVRVMARCVALYTHAEWDKLIGRAAVLPIAEGEALMRALTSRAAEVAVDSQGRINLPAHLIAHAGLEKEAVVIGVGNHAEIWNPARLEENEMSETDIAASLTKLGI
ncbi:MAG: division/cell wall cluster transcriptional repressor MraZ [Oscillospiraceae bacterium]|nr:division/cell wall cluster transcriptional repressor MraZ [Oscillospiraceae bacterium]